MWDELEHEDIIEDTDNVTDPMPLEGLNEDQGTKQSKVLAIWIFHFLMSLQVKFKLSQVVVSLIMKFLVTLFTLLGSGSKLIADIAKNFPSSLHTAWSLRGEVKFTRFVVCRKCHKLSYFNDSVINIGGTNQRSKTCSFQKFPNHPQHRRRLQCGSLLLKTVELAGGRKYLYPYMTYCYLNLDVSLQLLLNSPNFLNNCELWRQRKPGTDMLSDIYDGKVWQDFLTVNGHGFLSEPNNYALMLNLDFFQPFKHVQYSLGAIYLTVLNLPRGSRNKLENVILVGLIPGPHEPGHDLNSYLQPLVGDLLKFWNGVELNIRQYGCQKIVKCALLCVSCDLPAGRKVCGFLGHGAHLGCSRCFKKFSGGVGSMDFSGFDRENWILRSGPQHKESALKTLSENTQTKRDEAESSSGSRYSVLLDLPYFDAPRMLVIDPMHNLFLGSAKHFMKSIFIGRGILSDSNFDLIQSRIDSFTVPSDIGRIPHKIRSGFSSFTADQWKNWSIYFSIIALRDIVPSEILECWRHFVLACRVLICNQISLERVKLGDALLLAFCKKTERLFRTSSITPNMHMHCHLRTCMEDYGPLHSFWLYAFERYNGILGSMPNNKKSIEIQLMKRFLREIQTHAAELPQEFSDQFLPLLPLDSASGSLADTFLHPVEISTTGFNDTFWTMNSLSHMIEVPKYSCRLTLTATQKSHLLELYADIHRVCRSTITNISTLCRKYAHISMYNKLLGTHKSRMSSSSVVFVSWKYDLFGLSNAHAVRAARIDSFCEHVVVINGKPVQHMLVNLSFFKVHPKHSDFGKPVFVCYYDLYESDGLYSLIPVQFIKSRCISLVDKLDGESVLFIVPIIDF